MQRKKFRYVGNLRRHGRLTIHMVPGCGAKIRHAIPADSEDMLRDGEVEDYSIIGGKLVIVVCKTCLVMFDKRHDE